jgi:DNA primase
MLRNHKQDLKYKTNNEYCGPCDKCGGEDRFLFFLEGQQFWCRQCDWKGDVIDYLRHRNPNMSFSEAQELSGKTTLNSARQTNKKSPFRSEVADPPDQWSEQAEQFTAECYRYLFEGCQVVNNGLHEWGVRDELRWLERDRGITIGTAQKHGLGWNKEDRYFHRKDWGLPTDEKDKLFLPAGLVIPTFKDRLIIRLRIRKPEKDRYGSYYIVPGSKIKWSQYGQPTTSTMIVESDLDAILINQNLNICSFAMTSTSLNPTRAEYDELMKSEFIIDSLDSDSAGIKKTFDIQKIFGLKYMRLPPIFKKDINDMRLAGVDINEWYKAGLKILNVAA